MDTKRDVDPSSTWPNSTRADRDAFGDLVRAYSLRTGPDGMPMPVIGDAEIAARDGFVGDPIQGGRHGLDDEWCRRLYGLDEARMAAMFGFDPSTFNAS